jgi:hypothetical protein
VILNAVLEAIRVPPPPVMGCNWNATTSKIAVSIDYRDFEMVEAGGVEPPSEKRCDTKTTCLAQFVVFAGGAWNEQETLPASPMVLARPLRTERAGPAHCLTLLAGPMSKARGSVRLIN